MKQWIENKLKQKAFQEKHKVTQLIWQKAELEKKIAQAKREKENKNNDKKFIR